MANQYIYPMKRLSVLLFLFFITIIAYGQDTISIRHSRYVTTFDRQLHYPVLVHWVVTKEDIRCAAPSKRTDDFKPDYAIPAETDLAPLYKLIATNYDRGHNMNADDNKCDIGQMHESFYFSNMAPQTRQLNRGPWKSLELQTRKMAVKYGRVEVWCGSYGKRDSIGVLKIPAYCWKIIKCKGAITAYLFPNDSGVRGHKVSEYLIAADKIRAQAKLALAEVK
jgi:endonuclease G